MKKSPGFFKYLLNKDVDINLERYQIYKEFNKENYNLNCLLYALKAGGLEEKKINKIITEQYIKSRKIPQCKLDDICIKLNINIDLYNDNNNYKHIKYPKKRNNKNKLFKIGALIGHYFLIEETKYTKNFLDESFDSKKKLNSFYLIKFLLERKEIYFKRKITLNNKLLCTQFYDKVEDINTLEPIGKNYKPIEYKPAKKIYKDDDIYFADFETYAADKTLIHIPYLCCLRQYKKINNKEYNIKKKNYQDLDVQTFYGESCAVKMLNYVVKKKKKKVLIYFHNLKYDITFIDKIFGLITLSRTKPDNKIIMQYCKYKGVEICFKDTVALIPRQLKKFSTMFNIESEKEIMPYSIYNLKNIQEKYINIETIKKNCIEFNKLNTIITKDNIEYERVFDTENWNRFLNNSKKWDCIIKDKVNIIKYSNIYCQLDCKVLNDGFTVFRKMIKKITDLDVVNYCTISSIADTYMIKNLAYKGIYAISGVPRVFIQKCVVGGRVMTRDNKPQYPKNKKIADIDAVSLYPSAIARLPGFLKGLPKIIKNFDRIKDKNNYYYYARIKINKVGTARHMPCISFMTDEGLRNFSNDLEGKIIYIDKVGLEDAVKFMNIEYSFIGGYYFNEGFNKKCIKLIKKLFQDRLDFKKEDNPIEGVIKLILNSIYGKTMLKSFDSVEKIMYKDKGEKYVIRNHNYIKEYKIVNDYYYIKKYYSIGDHYNRVHVGVQVLSMSKRIMNEVIYTCEDNNIKIYYQDTDSLHIDQKQMQNIRTLYNNKYNKELYGNELGQLNSDFEMKGCTEVCAINSIFLGKKMYIDHLRGKDENGKYKYHYHIRMKGVPTNSIYHYSELNNVSCLDVYKNLYNKKKIRFDLTCGGSCKKFEYNKKGDVLFKKDFTRLIKI